MDILVSGAGVAGPALAHCLHRHGHRVTVVDTTGRPVATMPSVLFGGDLEILRGDLAEVLFEATRGHTAYRFGVSIESVGQRPDGVDVTFTDGSTGWFDLVVGADGVHSNVRRLVFGDDPAVERPLGMYGCVFTMPNVFGLDRAGLMYTEPGRSVSVAVPHGRDAVVALYFTADGAVRDRGDVAAVFAGAGWRVPELLAAMERAGAGRHGRRSPSVTGSSARCATCRRSSGCSGTWPPARRRRCAFPRTGSGLGHTQGTDGNMGNAL
ncbi:hypothetical protein [Dactylosporangium fulvum]|uniref:Uncharacterized protein n=1 Tax=Dactylosporangium fulvum TaxID=53359 RepID=A0ABY5VN99_9ACTN|nr:hypothetical protein [Dactylosporangium fulvum]UWP78549.1 hypothetical protein Dfulv_25545 [Dactylosporangium fulvum]